MISCLKKSDWLHVAGSSARQTVGVLALQGGVDLHKQAFRALGCEVCEVRQPKHLVGVDRLVIPGGESTALLKLMKPWNFLSNTNSERYGMM